MFPSVLSFAFLLACLLSGSESVAATRSSYRGVDSGFFGARPPVTKDKLQHDTRLHKRDVCNDAFPGRYSQTCSPSQTLCCIRPDEDRPACMTILGLGFCCTEHTDCFVDLESACGDAGADQCAQGLCCPAQTNCVSNFNYTTDSLVRCNINRNLIPGISSSSSSSTASSTPSASTTSTISDPAPTATPTGTSAVPTPTNIGGGSQNSLSGGAIAGIVIGSVAAVGIWAIAGWLFWRRRQSNKTEAAPMQQAPYQPYPQYPYYPQPQEMSDASQVHEAMNGAGYYPDGQPKERYARTEMPSQERTQELP